VIAKQAVLLALIHHKLQVFPKPKVSVTSIWSCSSLQWRDRAGIQTASLLSPCGHLFLLWNFTISMCNTTLI